MIDFLRQASSISAILIDDENYSINNKICLNQPLIPA